MANDPTPLPPWDALAADLAARRAGGTYRRCSPVGSAADAKAVVDGREMVHLGSNNYLGLANDPAVVFGGTRQLRPSWYLTERLVECLVAADRTFRENPLRSTAMVNRAGEVVQPDEKSFAAAAANADWTASPGFGVNLNNQAGDAAWPITSASYILMHKTADKPERSAEVLKFFRWALNNGQQLALELDYVPLPDEVVDLIEASWSQIADASGKPVLGD